MPRQAFEIRTVFAVLALVLLAGVGAAFWSSKTSQGLEAKVRTHDAVALHLERLLSAFKDTRCR